MIGEAEARPPDCVRVLAGASLLIAICADAVTGLAILRGSGSYLLLAHVPVVLGWGGTLAILFGQWPGVLDPHATGDDSARESGEKRQSESIVRVLECMDGRIVAALMLGVVLFPGIGILGLTLALCVSPLSHWLRPRPSPVASSLAHAGLDVGVVDLLGSLDVEPLVDVLHGQDEQRKRAAIAVLCQTGYTALPLARALLTDDDAEIRTYASVAVDRLESDFGRALSEASARVTASPGDVEAQLELALLNYRYAHCGPPDEGGRRLYLDQARDRLRLATSLDPSRPDLWVELARVEHELGDEVSARQAIREALAVSPDQCDAWLLSLDIALRDRYLGAVADLMVKAPRKVVDDPALSEALGWWTPGPLEARGAA